MDESDFKPLTCSGNCGSESGVSAAYHDEVIAVFRWWSGGEIEFFPAKFEKSLGFVGRGFCAVLGKEDGVTTSVESGKVLEVDLSQNQDGEMTESDIKEKNKQMKSFKIE